MGSGIRELMMNTIGMDAVKRKLKFDYIKAKSDPSFKALDLIGGLLQHFLKPQLDINSMMQDACNQIQRQFRVRYTMIGLKSLTDGLYKYEYQAGMRQEAWDNQRRRTYKRVDFDLHTQNYNASEISKITRAYLEEDNPLATTDLTVLNRPVLHGGKRREEDDALEADFIDTLIMGPYDELLGWIEYPGTLTGKLPDAVTMRNVEIVAGVLSVALRSLGYAKQ
ncbi:MAG TPA: hypothetical protein VGB78_09170 [Thermoplasmata archaeon]